MKKILSIIVIFFVLVGCNPQNKSKAKILSEYPNLKDKNHVFIEASFNEVIDLLNNKTGVVIFSFSTCPYCQAVMPILNESAKQEDFTEVLYFDIYEIRKNKTDEYQQLIEIISKQVDDLAFEEDQTTPRITVPDVYFVKDGKIISHYIATFKDQDGKWIKDLTISQQNELKAIYREYFQKLTKN